MLHFLKKGKVSSNEKRQSVSKWKEEKYFQMKRGKVLLNVKSKSILKRPRVQTRNVALSEKRKSIFNGNLAPRPNTGKYFCPRCKLSWRPRLKHLREICFGTSNCRGMDQCCSLVCMLVGPLASGGLKGCLQQALGQQLDISKWIIAVHFGYLWIS